MTTAPLLFEETSSPLYRSNDGRILKVRHWDDIHHQHYWVIRPTGQYDGTPLIETANEIVADAYIAGYDEANRAATEGAPR